MSRLRLAALSSLAAACLSTAAAAAPPKSGERPPKLGDLARGASFTLHDQWAGLGKTYALTARFDRMDGDKVYVSAVLVTRNGASAKALTIDAAPLRGFLAAVAARDLVAPKAPAGAMVSWTDDYPSGELLAQPDLDAAPLRIYFNDQHRIWHVAQGPTDWLVAGAPADREGLAPATPAPQNQPALLALWDGLRGALDLRAWIDAEYAERGHIVP